MRIYPHPRPAAALQLLSRCGLPVSDLKEDDLEHFFACGSETDPTGVVGVEVYGEVGLLRSLAVEEALRGRGFAERLMQEAETYARANGVKTLYLLTTTAAKFFVALGYAEAPREAAPEAVRATSQFASLCPASSILMVKRLR